MRYDRGDEVILKVEDSFGHTDTTYREVKVMVIGYSTDTEGSDLEYLCYVPPYSVISSSFTLREWHAKRFGIDQKFIGDQGCYITNRTPIAKKLPATPGEKCRRCREFTAYALPVNGGYFCRACKENPYR